MIRILRELVLQITALFRSRNLASEIDAEVEQHLEFATADFIAEGMSPKEARLAALRKFGNVEGYKDRARDSWGTRGVLDALRDLKFGARLCMRYPSTSVMAIAVLSIGIGLGIVMFTVSSKLLLVENPYGQRVHIAWEAGSGGAKDIFVQDFKVMREKVRSLENIVGVHHTSFWLSPLEDDLEGKLYPGVRVSPEIFDGTNVKPIRGRMFTRTGFDHEALISESVWTTFFDRSESVVGSLISLDRRMYEVVGILPASFAVGGDQKIWVSTDWEAYDDKPRLDSPRLKVSGKLKRGVNLEEAKKELEEYAEIIATQYPDTNEKLTEVELTVPETSFFSTRSLFGISVTLVDSLLMLCMTCVTAFNIIMIRTAKRTHELAARCALGAKRGHVLWQVIVDGLTLSGIGSILGLVFAVIGLKYAAGFFEDFGMPGFQVFRMSPWVVVFAVLTALASGVGSSIIPAWRASKMNAFALLKDDSRSSSGIYIGWLSKVAVVSQIAFSALVLYIGITLLLTSYVVGRIGTTFDRESILAGQVGMWTDPGIRGAEDILDLYSNVKVELEKEEGVLAVAMTSKNHGFIGSGLEEYEMRGIELLNNTSWNKAITTSVTPDYLKVYEIEPVSGRMIQNSDTTDSEPVCIVSEEFVKYRCMGVDPVGSQLRLLTDDDVSEWVTIVGVIPGVKPVVEGAEAEIDSLYVEILFPMSQRISWNPTLLVSATDASDPKYKSLVRRVVQEVAPLVRMNSEVLTIDERINLGSRFIGGVSKSSEIVGLLTLLVSVIGLYSIVTFTASLRKKEFGIRLAIGASRWEIAHSVLKPWFITISIGLGVAAMVLFAVVGTYFIVIESLSGYRPEFDTQWRDFGIPMLFTVLIIGITSLAAMITPAWRSTKIDPMEVIRVE